MIEKLELTVDDTEVVEAGAVLGRWQDRGDELPVSLRSEIERLAAAPKSESFLIEHHGPEIRAICTPAMRAVIANLRAREA